MAARKKKTAKKKSRKKSTRSSPRARKGTEAPTPQGGRPPYEFDTQALETLKRLAKSGNSVEDMALIMAVSKPTLERRIALESKLDLLDQDPCAIAYHQGIAERRDSLRVAQYGTALRGNATMQIFLGQNELGQRNFKHVEHSGGMDISVDNDLNQVLDERLTAWVRQRNAEKRSPDTLH